MEMLSYIFYFVYILLVLLVLRMILITKDSKSDDTSIENMEDKFAHLLRNPNHHARLHVAFANLRAQYMQPLTEKKQTDEEEELVDNKLSFLYVYFI